MDAAVTAEKLRVALAALLTEAPSLNADEVFKRARQMRDRLDQAGIAAREKQARDDRYLKVYRLSNGNVRLNGLFAPEDGEFVISTFDSITSPRRGGVRFVDPERAAWAQKKQDDPRSTEQINTDSLVQLPKVAGEADPGRVFGGRRQAARDRDREGPHSRTRRAGCRRTRRSRADRRQPGPHLAGNHRPGALRRRMPVGRLRQITSLDRSPPHQRLAHRQRRHQPRRRSTALPPAPSTAAQPAVEDHPHRNATLAAATGGERPGTDTDRTAEQAGGAVGRGSRPGS
ncbi:DUF222 domain-containing protein [Cryobacterium sp. TMT1-62]|nr:DUF222 domain-containing protein [Cryobacterium sp. TMT1-62]